jgi:hypothetical protein
MLARVKHEELWESVILRQEPKQIHFFIYPEAYRLATKEPVMSPEPVNEKPVRKSETRGGDKSTEWQFPEWDEEGTLPYLDADDDDL